MNDGWLTLTVTLPELCDVIVASAGGAVVVVVLVGGAVVVVVETARRCVADVAGVADCLLLLERPIHQTAPTPARTRVPTSATAIGANERGARKSRGTRLGMTSEGFACSAPGRVRARDAACCSASSARCWCSTDSSGVGACRYQRRSANSQSKARSTPMTTGIELATSLLLPSRPNGVLSIVVNCAAPH